MKTLQKLTLMLLVIFMASCSKDDDSPAVDNTPHDNLILKTTDSDDGLIRLFAYDSNNKLISYKSGFTIESATGMSFTYDASGRLQKATEDVSNQITEYFYDAQNRLIKQLGRNGTDIHLYTYNGNQVVIDNYTFTVTNEKWRTINTYDAKGNLIEVKSYVGITADNPDGNYNGRVSYVYNDKKSSQASVPAAFNFPSSNVNDMVSSQYNDTTPINYTSEYNADGYPTKKTSSYTRVFEYKRL